MEAVMCKSFSSTLTGTAQKWYSALSEKSIKFFSSQATTLVNQSSDIGKIEKDVDDLYDMR